jgi:hypothetical protein
MFENTYPERHGHKTPPVLGKRGELSPGARRRLWNIFHSDFTKPNTIRIPYTHRSRISPVGELFLEEVWTELFKGRVDGYPGCAPVLAQISANFERGDWHFPFVVWEEIFKSDLPIIPEPEKTAERICEALERENAAYTFVGGLFVDRMAPEEVKSIEVALESPLEGIREHFKAALRMLSDRDDPDYRNSVKESISAVEAACRYLTKRENAILTDALKILDNQRPFHPAFKEGLIKLYAWTSDEGGIRHSIKDVDKVERADAQYMLVACSAFVNYLLDR